MYSVPLFWLLNFKLVRICIIQSVKNQAPVRTWTIAYSVCNTDVVLGENQLYFMSELN